MYNSNAKHVFYYCSKLHNLRQKFIFALGNEVVSIIAIALPKLDWTLPLPYLNLTGRCHCPT